MSFFVQIMKLCMDFLKTPLHIWGYTFSFLNVLVFTEVFALALVLLRRIF